MQGDRHVSNFLLNRYKMKYLICVWAFGLLLLCQAAHGPGDPPDKDDPHGPLDSQDEESSDQEDDLPDHHFLTKHHVTQTGKKKGEGKWFITLLVPPYVFQKRSTKRNGLVFFSCRSCDKQGVHLPASALLEREGTDEEEPKLRLVQERNTRCLCIFN